MGIHVGECELHGAKLGGIAVVVGARIGALAGPSQVLVSQTVKDIVTSSGWPSTTKESTRSKASLTGGDSTPVMNSHA